MAMFQKPRGTIDYYGSELQTLAAIEEKMKRNAHLFGFNEIRTPIFEHTEVFVRSVGASSDIVKKEIYNFLDKGGRDITLRPEGTAGVIRAVNENKLLQQQNFPLRLFYYGPVFRYERPQSGRARQFHQFGFEILNTKSYYDDVDCLVLAKKCLDDLNIHHYTLHLNCIGSVATRMLWINELKKYFEPYKNQLSPDSLQRLETNPLRILDDKEDGNKEFVLKAPKIQKYLTQQELTEFQNILALLDQNNVNYVFDETLVRGLDYYTNLVFEFVSDLDELKGQSTICGGGRYNNLIQELGGLDAQAVGFAFGLERILIQYEVENKNILKEHKNFIAAFVNLSDDLIQAYDVVNLLRSNNLSVVFDSEIKKLNAGFKFSETLKAKYVLIFGNEELKNQTVVVKNQTTLLQETVALKNLVNYLKNN